MKAFARENNIRFAGVIPFDRDVTASMNAGKSLVEFSQGPAAQAVVVLTALLAELQRATGILNEDRPTAGGLSLGEMLAGAEVADRVMVMRLGRVQGIREVARTTPEELVGLITGAIPGDHERATEDDGSPA